MDQMRVCRISFERRTPGAKCSTSVSTRLVQVAKNVDLVLVNGKFVDGRGVIGSALTIQNGRIVNVGICGEEPLIPLLVRRGIRLPAISPSSQSSRSGNPRAAAHLFILKSVRRPIQLPNIQATWLR